jgi:hypothetical protein
MRVLDVRRSGVPYMCANHDEMTHNINWAYQNKLREQWLLDNPDAQYIGWMSILVLPDTMKLGLS